MFAGTVAENIARFGDVDSEKVILAAKRTGVHEMILHLPEGYDTHLGDGGAGLSGGQKQRLGLARALYDDPSLIVLDEPNSNLDEVGEQALLVALNDLRQRGKTIVMITHRTNAISITNKLLLIRDGIGQLFGPRDEVLAAIANANQQQAQLAQQRTQQAQQAQQASAVTVAESHVPADTQTRIEDAVAEENKAGETVQE